MSQNQSSAKPASAFGTAYHYRLLKLLQAKTSREEAHIMHARVEFSRLFADATDAQLKEAVAREDIFTGMFEGFYDPKAKMLSFLKRLRDMHKTYLRSLEKPKAEQPKTALEFSTPPGTPIAKTPVNTRM